MRAPPLFGEVRPAAHVLKAHFKSMFHQCFKSPGDSRSRLFVVQWNEPMKHIWGDHGMQLRKKETLKTSYYRSFLLLIVVPILVITMSSIGIIRKMMKDAAIQNIRRAQDNIVSTLNTEVKDVSLRLSHFVYVNDNEIMKIAAKTDTEDASERYHYTRLLTESFNYAMVPVQDILSAIFFMKDGLTTYMKDDTALTMEEIKASAWYQAALLDKNMVKIGFYNTNVTTSRHNANSFTIVAALSPGIDVDRDGNVEMAALFMTSEAGNMIKDYNREKLLGTTVILGGDGEVLFDASGTADLLPEVQHGGQEGAWWDHAVSHHRVGNTGYVYVASTEPETGCRVVSVIESGALTRDFTRAAMAVIGVTLVLFALFYRFSSYFLRSIVDPVHHVVEGMEQVEEGNLEVHVAPSGQAEIRTMVHSFNSMVRRLKHLIEENQTQQEKKHEAEIRALQSQINPHFLVNSLNSIRFMAQVAKFEGIRKMAEALMKILSTSFRSNAGFYSLKEELEVLDSFVYLMKIRYSDGFEIEYRVDEACLCCRVPRLILQPIVENSIVHGFSELVDEIGRIDLTIEEEDGHVCITVQDNGKGMAKEEIGQLMSGVGVEKEDHTSIGVVNVLNRLKLNYGEQCGLDITSEPGKFTRTRICIPMSGCGSGEESQK